MVIVFSYSTMSHQQQHQAVQVQLGEESKWTKRNQKWQQYICSGCPPQLDAMDPFRGVSIPVFPGSHPHPPLEAPSTSRSTEPDDKSEDEMSGSGSFRPAGSSKKEKNRMKRREERSDPSYRDKERARARLRMQEKRKDPIYRELERMKNRLRMRVLRSSGEIKSRSEYKRPHSRKKNKQCPNILQVEQDNYHHSNAIQSCPTNHHIYNFIK